MPSTRFLVFIVIILFNNNNIDAQNNEIDSLINKLSIASADTLKVDVLIELSKGLTDIDLVNGEKYALQALELSKILDYSKGEADAYYYLGVYDFENRKFKDGAINQSASLRICLSQGNLKDAIYSYYELGSCYESLNSYDSAHYFYKIALELSDSIRNDTLIAHSNYYLAEFSLDRGKNKVALKYALKAHEYYNSHNLKEDDWYVLNILGIIHSDIGLYAESLYYNMKALDISVEFSDKNGEIIMRNNIAVLYNELKKNDLAIKYYEDAYEATKIIGDPDMEATLLGNLAGLKAELGDTITALLYTRKALSIQLENEFTCALPYSYEGFGDLFIGQNMFDSAVYYLEKALKIGIDCEDLGMEISVTRNLGIAYRKQKKLELSEKFLSRSLQLSRTASMKNEEREAAFELYRYFKLIKNNKKALEFHEYYQSLGDSIFNLMNAEKVNELTSEYEFRKEKKLLELENEKLLLKRESELENQTIIRNAALMILFFAIIFLIMIYQSNLYIKLQNNRLKVLNNEKNTLMGIVAHDLRNPLNNIKTIIPIMKDKSPEAQESMEELVDMIGNTTDRMYGMIDRILDVNAVEEMKIKLKLKNIDLGIVVKEVCQSFHMPAERKGIHIDCEIKEGVHYSEVDENYLIQVLENLVSNAIKFSSKDTLINLSINAVSGMEEIKVTDQGPGINENERSFLFKKYGKLSNEPTAGEPSTGLGLSIVKKYVDAMNGNISLESNIGEGSTFIVSFKRTNKS